MQSASPPLKLPRSLLVGVDDTPRTKAALEAALALAEPLAASVELVHAVHIPILEWTAIDPLRETGSMAPLVEQAGQRLRLSLSQLGLPAAAKPAIDGLRALPGKPAQVLLGEVKQERGDLLVLGAHRPRGWIDFGGTALSLLSHSPVPIWVQSQPPRSVRKILAPIDLSEDSLRSLGFACMLGQVLGARVQAVQFFDVAALFATSPDAMGLMPRISVEKVRVGAIQAFDRCMQTFDWRGVEHTADFREGEPAQAILELARQNDLVVIATHGYSGLTRAVIGSVARRVLAHAETPVLALPHARRKFLF